MGKYIENHVIIIIRVYTLYLNQINIFIKKFVYMCVQSIWMMVLIFIIYKQI